MGGWLHRTLVLAELGPEADLLVLDTTTMARGTNLGRYLTASARYRRFLIGYAVFHAILFVAGGAVALWFAMTWAFGSPWAIFLGVFGVGMIGFALYQVSGVRVMWRHRHDPVEPVWGAASEPAGRR